MSNFLQNLVDFYQKRLEKHRNRAFLEAAMAACALVAMANGSVTFRQRVRLDQIMETLEALRIFDPHDGVGLFNEYVQLIREAPAKGHDKVMQLLLKGAQQEPERSELLMRICLAVSEVDGSIPLTEQIEIVGLCSRLGLEPKSCGLYTDPSSNNP